MQETHSTKEDEARWRKEWAGMIFFSHGDSKSRGTAILLDESIQYHLHETKIDPNGRYVIIDIEIYGVRFSLGSIYAPNIDDEEFYKNIIHCIENFPNDNRILCGDFNLVLDINIDKKGGLKQTNYNSQRIIKSYMSETEMVDIYRHIHGDKKVYTWFRKVPSLIACRLDYFLVSSSLVHKVHGTGISPSYLSDHSRVYLKIKLSKEKRGPGFWKMNTSHLKDEEFCRIISQCIRETKEINNGVNILLLWETIKCAIRGESIKFGAKKKRERNARIKELECHLSLLEEQYMKSESTDNRNNINNEMIKVKSDLDFELECITKGHILRSKINEYELGEKSNSYFFNMEKRNYNRKHIKQLIKEDGSIECNPKNILEMQRNYYQILYTKSNQSEDDMLGFVNNYTRDLPKISADQKIKLDAKITLDEISKVIKNMKNDKTPGIDGLPVEFYKVFWLDIKDILYLVVEESKRSNSLTITQKQGIISLLPKPNKDLLLLKNWRPLTLMNVDYKIISGCLASRMKSLLDGLISPEQSGFIPGRYIGENIFKLTNLMEFCQMQKINGMLVLIDFQKAFDLLSWSFINFILKMYNFPAYIISWINILYSDKNTSCVMNNGWSSQFFNIGRGVKQGCPLSPYLFILCGEVLSNAINNCSDIEGIDINGFVCKILQYADDTCITIKKCQKSLKSIFHILKEYQKASGLQINIDKTEILRLGPFALTEEKLCPEININWKNDYVKVLGIYLCNKASDVYETNFSERVDNAQTIVNIWSKRYMTLYGKSLIAKSFVLSQFMYQITVLPTLDSDIDTKINAILFKFLWDNKPDKIKRQIVCSEHKLGGIKFPNISIYLASTKITWIKRILNSNDLMNIANFYFPNFTQCKDFILHCNLRKDDVKHFIRGSNLSIIYEIFYYFATAQFRQWNRDTIFSKEIVFLNSNIRINNKPFLNINCIQNNILRVNDFMIDGIMFQSFEEFVHTHGNILNFLDYYSITHSIKMSIQNAHHISIPGTIEKKAINPSSLLSAAKPQKYVYNTLSYSTPSILLDRIANKWSLLITDDITPEDISNMFNSIYKTTINNKLRVFMYKYYHMKIFLNPELKRINLCEVDTCTFCSTESETYNHLFMSCRYVIDLWASLRSFCSTRFNFALNVNSLNDIILLSHIPNNSILMYLLCFVTLHYIYKCRLSKSVPSCVQLYREFYRIEQIEGEIAKANNKYQLHVRKWNL